jgi:hypothetical protein
MNTITTKLLPLLLTATPLIAASAGMPKMAPPAPTPVVAPSPVPGVPLLPSPSPIDGFLVDLREKGDSYNIYASLANGSPDVDVTVKSPRTLLLSGPRSTDQKKRHQHLVTLPAPAAVNGMKVQRRAHEIVVMIPKLKK